MADYRLVRVADVPDQGPNLGLGDKGELRFLRNDLGCESCGVSYERLSPGFRLPYGHKHKRQEEVYLLVSGSARMKVDDEILELEPWTAVRVPPGTMRSLEAGEEGAEFVVVGAPNTGPGDGEIVPGWWSE